jgi:hypothetical protein
LVGEKAFDWKGEFPDVFAAGGFDVVVGNPPYGVNFTAAEKKYLNRYDALVPDFEIYIYFISLYRRILKNGGYLSYIFPNTFLVNVYGLVYRTRLFETASITRMLDLSNDPTFADASVRTIVLALANRVSDYETVMNVIDPVDKTISPFQTVTKQQLTDSLDNVLALFTRTPEEAVVIQKIRSAATPLVDIMDVSQGYIPYRRSDLVKTYGKATGESIVDNREWHSPTKLDDTYKRDLAGKELYRYSIRKLQTAQYVKYGKHVASYVDPKFFTVPRILVREITSTHLYAAFTDEELYTNPSVINAIPIDPTLDLYAVLAVINSRLMGWYHTRTSPKAKKGLFPKILVGDVRSLPIVLPEDTSELHDLAVTMTETWREIQNWSDNFKLLIMSDLKLPSWPQNLGKWWAVDFDEFITRLVKRKLTLAKKNDVMVVFNQYRADVLPLVETFDRADERIDTIVYDLYGLNSDDIAVISG